MLTFNENKIIIKKIVKFKSAFCMKILYKYKSDNNNSKNSIQLMHLF